MAASTVPDNDTAYVGHAAFESIVMSGFTENKRSDFKVKCGNRIFHTHKLVLEHVPYFDRAINGSFKEADDALIDLHEEDEDIVQIMLSQIYGADLGSLVAKQCRRPCSTTTMISAFRARCEVYSFEMAEKHLYTPSAHLAIIRDFDEETSAVAKFKMTQTPQPCVAEQLCKELFMLMQVYIMADKYGVKSLSLAVQDLVRDLACDCWAHPAVLDAITYLFSRIPSWKSDPLAIWLAAEIAERFSLYKFCLYSPVNDCPAFAQAIIMTGASNEIQTEWNTLTDGFCMWYKCRKNGHQFGAKCMTCSLEHMSPVRYASGDDEDY